MKAGHRRTVFLGVLTTVVFVWAAITKFDVPAEELAWLLLYCLIGVVAVAVMAGLTVALVLGFKKLSRSLRDGSD